MEITTRTVGKCKVLDCHGQLSFGSSTTVLRQAIHEAVEDGTLKVSLNLADVSYLDSSGIDEMISGYVHVKQLGGNMSLLNLNEKFRKLLAVAKLLTIFDVFDDEKKALEGCE
jgi:anti-sigma B factor antagonist